MYEGVEQSREATYFNTTQARWDQVMNMRGVGSKGMIKINQAFLKTFLMVSNPTTAGGYFFMKEVAYLVSKGIHNYSLDLKSRRKNNGCKNNLF